MKQKDEFDIFFPELLAYYVHVKDYLEKKFKMLQTEMQVGVFILQIAQKKQSEAYT